MRVGAAATTENHTESASLAKEKIIYFYRFARCLQGIKKLTPLNPKVRRIKHTIGKSQKSERKQ